MSPYQRAIMFVDNAGADVVLGMIPFARELLRMGAEVRGWGWRPLVYFWLVLGI